MIEQQAKVIASNEKTVWLQAERQSTCSKCQVRQGCGTAMLENHVGKRFSTIEVERVGNVNVGQEVTLGIPEEALLSGTFVMYILPVLAMFFGAILARGLNLPEIWEIIFGFTCLFSSFFWVKTHLRTKTNEFNAKIIEEQK
jgi:sigma-E factor negative regulatory protein RseC